MASMEHISQYGYDPISAYSLYEPYSVGNMAAKGDDKVGGSEKTEKPVVNPGESTKVAPGRKSSPAECKTCKERKYQDGSNEMVSFKSAQHISPESAYSRVRAHEQEHVSNAYKKAAQSKGAQVVNCSVAIHTAICPECGRSYVSGGTTSTSIKYKNESNPYTRDMKAQHADAMSGANVDFAV